MATETPAAALLPQPPSLDAKFKEFDAVPLFMRTLPDEDVDDIAISALQSLAHEGTPDELAQNFKEQGNDYFKGKRYREALGFYTQGVEAKPTDSVLHEAILCNRAACNLELQNYGSVLRDCSKALTLNPKSSKAYYRSSLALVALDRHVDALDACDRCLAFDSDNTSVKAVRERARKAMEIKEKKEKERAEKLKREQDEKRRLRAAFTERNLISVANPSGAADNPYAPHFDPEDFTNSTLIIPTFFLYPQHATSDLVSHFSEQTPFATHISAMFPPEVPAPTWDKNGEYAAGRLVVYAITHRRRLLKVGKKMTLSDVCAAAKGKEGERDGLEVKDGCVSFVVLPKGDVEQKWVSEFKSSRDSN